MNELIAGKIAAPTDLPADAVGSVGTPNTLPADSAGIVGTPNTVPADGAGIIAAPISLPSQGAAALPRSLTPMVEFDFAAKRYVQDGVAVAFEDIFTYTRASSATFTNHRLKKGGGYEYFLDTDYVGSVTNSITYSEDFSDSDWVPIFSTSTVNQLIAPDGTKTANKITYPVASYGWVYQNQYGYTDNDVVTFSAYYKAGSITKVKHNFYRGNVDAYIKVDLLSGAILNSVGNIESSVINVGDGWYKLSVTALVSVAAGAKAQVARQEGAELTSGGYIYAWGAQVTESAKVLPYVKTLDVAVTKTFAETLRTEYDAVTGENLGALIEGASTNLALWSEDFSNAVWNKSSLTPTANAIIAPDGTLSGDLITITVGSGHALSQPITVIASTQYAFSFYVKKGTATDLKYSVWDSTNLGNIVAPTSYFTEIGTDWTRISVTFTAPVGCTTAAIYPVRDSGVTGTAYIWGAQCEVLPFASSYIRTEGSAVSRSSDDLRVASAGNFDADEYTIAIEGNTSGTSTTNTLLCVSDSTNNNRLQLTTYTSKSFGYFTASGGSVQGFTGTGPVTKDTIKGVLTYTPNNLKGYFNGELFSTDTSSLPLQNDNTIFIGNMNNTIERLFGHMGKVSIYAQALTAQEVTLL